MTRYRVTATKPGHDSIVFESEWMSLAIWWQQTTGAVLTEQGWTVSDIETVGDDWLTELRAACDATSASLVLAAGSLDAVCQPRSEAEVVSLLGEHGFVACDETATGRVIPFARQTAEGWA